MSAPALWSGPGADAHGPDVKYFSGTATYRHTFTADPAALGAGRRLVLDLDDVSDLAAGDHTRPGAAIFDTDAEVFPAGIHGPVRLTVQTS
ncbi:hypothetical protein ACFVYC_15755 [Pseudarthrobacter sp. NPDC058329]|uniref:hypothetical protein n=1 Tax=Pseudarthrobacter sp. NPDC058329 TaxID=3346448 RepID=UPI0036DB86BC